MKSENLPPNELKDGDVKKITGYEQEHNIFGMLQSALAKKRVKDTVVLLSWSIKSAEGRKGREFDFLIVSLPLKSIFQIEVKTSSNEPSLKDGVDQLEEGKKFFCSTIPFPQNVSWKMVRALCFGELRELKEPLNSCKNCTNFLLTKDTDFGGWWDVIGTDQATEPIRESDKNTYLTVLKSLLFQMFLQDDLITKGLLKLFSACG